MMHNDKQVHSDMGEGGVKKQKKTGDVNYGRHQTSNSYVKSIRYHYKPRLVWFFTPFFTAVNITDNLCTKQENSSIKYAVYNQERFQIKSEL